MNKDVQEFKHIHLNKSQESLRAFEDHEKKMKKELETVKYATIETRNAVKDIQSDIYSQIRKEPSPETKPKLTKDQTEAILQTEANYVITEQFQEAQNTLMVKNCVVICGGLGEGKTSAAFELMRRNRKQKRCIQIENPDNIRRVEPNVFDFVFIDDIFGNYELDENKFQSCLAVFEKLQNLIRSNAFKLIITSSEIAFNESRGLLEKFSLFKGVVFFKTDKLKTKEIQDILHQCLTAQNRVLSPEFVARCIAAYKSSSSFPYVCFLFASDDMFFEEKECFFLRKEVIGTDILSHLNKAKQLTLLYLWFKGGNCLEISDIPEQCCSFLKTLSNRLEYSKDITTLCHEVNHNLDVMNGAFIKKQVSGYAFAHNSIYRTIGLFFARRGFHDIIIAQSNIDFFMECIRIDEHDGNRDYNVSRDLYTHVVDRIILEVMQNKRCRAMAIHPCLTNEIFDLLFRKLMALNKLKAFFLSEKNESTSVIYYTREDDTFGQFLFHILKSTSSISITVLKAVIKHLKHRHTIKQTPCKVCKMFENAYKGACRGGNLEALKLLGFVKVKASELITTVFSNKKEIYQFVSSEIHGYKENNELKMQCLQLSIILGHTDVFDQILHDGIKPDVICFKLAVSNKRYEFIEMILRYLAMSAEYQLVLNMLGNLDSYEPNTALAQCGLQLVNCFFPELPSVVRSGKEKSEVNFVISELEKQCKANVLNMLSCGEIDPNSVLPYVLRWYCSACFDATAVGKIDSILKFIDESQNCSVSLKIVSKIVQSDSSKLLERCIRHKVKAHDICLRTALEMAIYFDQDTATRKLLYNLNVLPTPYCLFQATAKGKKALVKAILQLIPFAEIQSSSVYFKLSLSHCVSTNDMDMFRYIMKETKFEIDSELLFEAVLSRNEMMVVEIKSHLEKNDKWDYSLKEYWISSALIEAKGSPSVISCLEDYYDDAISIIGTYSNSDLFDPLSSFSESCTDYEDIE
ncbi:uncharacterized protein LOC123542364 [Mercenaria mercenaria]|uniref:uncharacterized protein LOC123542364 n=1 Tax=Mercenaria mercenaria TaxID=6596 RepID=UPI00234F79E7|nr:uncharacterized protein LOC123542364 [Mercenaria mercenaria]